MWNISGKVKRHRSTRRVHAWGTGGRRGGDGEAFACQRLPLCGLMGQSSPHGALSTPPPSPHLQAIFSPGCVPSPAPPGRVSPVSTRESRPCVPHAAPPGSGCGRGSQGHQETLRSGGGIHAKATVAPTAERAAEGPGKEGGPGAPGKMRAYIRPHGVITRLVPPRVGARLSHCQNPLRWKPFIASRIPDPS